MAHASGRPHMCNRLPVIQIAPSKLLLLFAAEHVYSTFVRMAYKTLPLIIAIRTLVTLL
jgi:hypothetical protein